MDQTKIGEFIKSLRKAKGLSQTQVAEALYVTQKTVSRWENGEGIPDISIIKEVASFFNVTVDELLDGEIKNKEQSSSTIKRKEVDRTKLVSSKLLNNLSKAIFGAIATFAVFILTSIILLFTIKDEFIVLTISYLGIFISIIIYLLFYFDIKNKIKNEEQESININTIKKNLRLKTIEFLNMFFILFFVNSILNFIVLYVTGINVASFTKFIEYFGLISIIIVTYILILPMINEGKIEKKYVYRTLNYLFLMSSILSIIFILKYDLVYSNDFYGPYFGEDYKSLPIITLIGKNGAGTNYFRISGFVMILVSISLIILFTYKNKTTYSIISSLLGYLGSYLMIYDHLLRPTVGYRIDIYVGWLPFIILLITLVTAITYFILKIKDKRTKDN